MRRLISQLLPVSAFTREDRRVSAVMWVAAVMQGFAQAQVTNTLPFVRLSLEVTEGQMSSLLAIARLGAFLAFPFTLRGDRLGRRGPFLVAFAILMAANAATALAYQPAVFAGLQALVRMGTTAVGVLAIVLIVEQLSPQVRAYGLSIYGAGGSFGAGIALAVLPLARLGDLSWRLLFAASALGLLLLPFLARQVRESPIHDEYDLGRTGLLAPLASEHRRSFVVLAVSSFLAAAYTTVAISFSFERLVNDVGLSVGTAVWISLIGGTVGGIGFFIGGRIADEVGRRAGTIIGFLLAVAGGLGLYWLDEPIALAGAVFVSTFGAFAAIPSVGAQRNELFPTGQRATAVTWLNNFGVLGSVAGLALGSATIDTLGLSETVSILAAGMVVAALVVLLLPETRGQPLGALITER